MSRMHGTIAFFPLASRLIAARWWVAMGLSPMEPQLAPFAVINPVLSPSQAAFAPECRLLRGARARAAGVEDQA
jgi:hypothetical protein